MTNQITLNLYCDEIKEVDIIDPILGNEKWAYIGILIVPALTEEELISKLLDKRCGNPKGTKSWAACVPFCKYHQKNDKEVHYQKTDSMDQYFIASRWLDFLLTDTHLTYFYILGLDLMRLDYSYFGEAKHSDRFEKIYNRFFRTAVLKSVKSYFSKYETIEIKSIVHDQSEMSSGAYFPWHSIFRIGRDDGKIGFSCKRIEFINSDHRKSTDKRSHLIQYIDLILGATYNALHWTSHDDNKMKLSLKLVPLLKRMMHKPNNTNSHYQYVGRTSIDFFPKYNYQSLSDWEKTIKSLDSFYKKRELRIERF
ncbi:MAG: hypothetical protein AB1393_14505, partial [Candidatus Edwardsbacteria bacterium]